MVEQHLKGNLSSAALSFPLPRDLLPVTPDENPQERGTYFAVLLLTFREPEQSEQ